MVEKLHSEDRLTDEQREAALTNIATATDVAAAAEADFVIERGFCEYG
jgi:3-hydroxyacyl-CoA dehydrogenase